MKFVIFILGEVNKSMLTLYVQMDVRGGRGCLTSQVDIKKNMYIYVKR